LRDLPHIGIAAIARRDHWDPPPPNLPGGCRLPNTQSLIDKSRL